jgi:hypothetical protein
MQRSDVNKWQRASRNLWEALALIALATGILAAGVASSLVLDKRFGLSREWRLFVGGAEVYTVVTIYLLNEIKPLRKRFHLPKMLAAAVIMEAPVVALWFLFYADILALPESMFPYTIGGIVVAPAMVMLIESFVLSGRDTPWSKPSSSGRGVT